MAATNRSMAQTRVLAWIVLLVFETLSQVGLKMAGEALASTPFGLQWFDEAAQDHWVWAGVAGYIGAFGAWMVILDDVPLSLGFPLTAVVLVAIAAASYYLFGEVLSSWRLAGIGIIILGLVIMGGDDS